MLKEIFVPDIGNFAEVDVIEILVRPGDTIAKEAGLITLETAKATLEVPSPVSGIVKSIDIKVGDKVSKDSKIASIEVEGAAAEPEKADPQKEAASQPQAPATQDTAQKTAAVQSSAAVPTMPPQASLASAAPAQPQGATESMADVHAGPGVRQLARELGVNLNQIVGTGPKSRVLLTDIKDFVKKALQSKSGTGVGGLNLAPWPEVDHAKFGPISKETLPRIKKLTGAYLHRNWVSVPHITQFDEADITELEAFRKLEQKLAEEQGFKLTPLVFIMKAVVAGLKAFRQFNSSLAADGQTITYKNYFHLGIAVDTPQGLVVPVVRDVDQKGLFQLAKELAEISIKARAGKLTAEEMQGSSFTITSLGGIGGTFFTPIVNVPDVAILGVSRSQMKPIYLEGEFKPRLILPLSLSYDHRVIDGAEGARFTSFLVKQLSDIRRLLL